MAKRRQFTAAFKVEVVLEILSGHKTMAELEWRRTAELLLGASLSSIIPAKDWLMGVVIT